MYKIYDYYESKCYEGKILVAECKDFSEVKKVKKQYILDTDGECDLDVEYIPEEEIK